MFTQFKTPRPSTSRGSSCYREKCVYIPAILTVEAFWPFFFQVYCRNLYDSQHKCRSSRIVFMDIPAGWLFCCCCLGSFTYVLGAHVVESMWSKKQISQGTVARVVAKNTNTCTLPSTWGDWSPDWLLEINQGYGQLGCWKSVDDCPLSILNRFRCED